ncbi:MAG: LAGLIDADG family homing endonuclease [Candidatus Hermodarchaeia archaeon]|jgi:intein/homing endonuclease
MKTVGMKSLDLDVISQALSEARVWHKIQHGFICTKKTRIKIPKICEKVAYFAGVVAGDGNLNKCKRKEGGYYYRVNVVGRKEYMEQLSVLIRELFHFQPRIHRDKRKKNCYAININCAAVYFFFIALGFQSGKKRNMRVPLLIANNASLFKHYMRGLIDTDGSRQKKRIQLKQRDRVFLKELVRLLKKHFDITSNPPKVNYTDGKPYYYIRFSFEGLTNA